MGRRRAQRTDRLLPRQRAWLLTGHDWGLLNPELGPGGPEGRAGFETEAAARAAWEATREELLAYWLQDPEEFTRRAAAARRAGRYPDTFASPGPGGPGTRPWGFWRFEAEVPRHVTERLEPSRTNELRALGWGTEAAWRAFNGKPWGDYLRTESQRAYIDRHRLWLPGEEEALRGPGGPRLVEGED